MRLILVVSDRPWVAAAFAEWRPGLAALVTNQFALVEHLDASRPEAVIFPHWSHRVPAAIYEAVPCIGFHLGDLPQGRGGTPLQNLILRGIYQTTLCAFRMTGEMDGGPVYLREPVDIGTGSAEAIYHDLARRSLRMAERILVEHIEPQPQVGRPSVWQRRTPSESLIQATKLSAPALYDFIRMLDAPGYPHAFANVAGYRVRFTNARMTGNSVVADAAFGDSE